MIIFKKFYFICKNNLFIYSNYFLLESILRLIFNNKLNDILYYNSLNVAFVSIPKTGNSSLNSVFLDKLGVIYDKKNYQSVHLSKNRFKINHKKLVNLDCYKFTFVRNPFERLVSCYVSKVLNENHNMNKKYFGIINRNLSFEKFVKIVCKVPNFMSDFHFVSQDYLLFENGKLIVDDVLKFEDLEKNFECIRKKYELNYLPHLNKTDKPDYRSFYTSELVKLVYSRYKNDIVYFDYVIEYEELLNFCKNMRN